jgi:hypothetical protein
LIQSREYGFAEAVVRYFMFVCRDPSIELTLEEKAGMPGWVSSWVEEMQARGVRLQGDVLGPPDAARTIRVRDGQVQTSTGAFATARETVTGFNILECRDLDEAIEVSTKHPIARFGSIEIRPIS